MKYSLLFDITKNRFLFYVEKVEIASSYNYISCYIGFNIMSFIMYTLFCTFNAGLSGLLDHSDSASISKVIVEHFRSR